MRISTLTAAILAGGTMAASAQTVDLRFSTFLPPVHGVHEALEVWGESIREKSGGTISITLYPAEQLGRANDHYDMTRDGIADLAYVNVGYQAGRFPLAEAVHLPFTVSDGVGGSRAFDAWYRPIAETEMSEVRFCLGFLHEPGSLHSKREIRTPAEVSGLKVRTANATIANFITSLGGANVRVSAPESRSALESGVADAVTFPWESVSIFGLDSVVRYSMDAPFYLSGFAWVMNRQTYDGMTDEQKAVMDEHCSTEWAGKVAATWSKHEKAGYERFKKREDYTVYALTQEELAAWREASAALRQRWVEEAAAAGADDPEGALARFEAALQAEGAGVR